jgi:hypothetical protein
MRHKIITPFFGRIMYVLCFAQVNFEKSLTDKVLSVSLVPLAILRLYYLTKELGTSDSPYNLTTSMLLEVIQMNVAVIVSSIPFSRLLITSVLSGLLTTKIRTHAPNFGGTAELNLSHTEQSFSQGALRTPTSRTSQNSKTSRSSNGPGRISLSDVRNSKSLDVTRKNVEYAIYCSVRDANGGSGSKNTTTSEWPIFSAAAEWAVDRVSLPDK